jgi:pyruvate dehydrogenase E2 component (dihydrolipoamide acetyltransferase)
VPYTVRMPQLGESVAEGTVSRWFKRVGERIEEDENLFEVSTDKVETEVPSPYSGWIARIFVQEGETVAVGTELCEISEVPLEEAASEPEQTLGGAVSVPQEGPQEGPSAPIEGPSAPEEGPPAPKEGPSAPIEPFEEAVTSTVTAEGLPEVSGDIRSTLQLKWEPARLQELHARPSEHKEGGPLPEESRLHAQPSLAREAPPRLEDQRLHAQPAHTIGGAPPSPPKPQARVTAEGLRRLEHPELGEEVRPGGSRRGIFSPAVRKKAKELGVDLDRIVGTGAGGRITLQDVEAAAAAPAAAPAGPEPTAEEQIPTREGAHAAEGVAPEASTAQGPAPALEGTTVPLSSIRRRIAAHMSEARRTAAHCFECIDVEMERVAAARDKFKGEFREKHGFSLTYLPFFSVAVCNALLEFPIINSRIDVEGGTATLFDRFVNLGIAVDLDGEGLIVPVIHRAHEMPVWELARRIHDISERARRKELVPDEVTGGTFTITNPGSMGTKLSVPIINTPEVAILSLEAIEDRAVVRDGEIVARKMTTIGLSWDHRAFDGADAARFLEAVKVRIEGSAEGWDWTVLAAPDI